MRKQILKVILMVLWASSFARAEGKLSDRVLCKYTVYEIDIAATKSNLLAEAQIPVFNEDQNGIQYMTPPTQSNPIIAVGYRADADDVEVSATFDQHQFGASGAMGRMKQTGGYFSTEHGIPVSEHVFKQLSVHCIKKAR